MEIIDFLVDYTVFHFDTEEALQRDRKYISYTQHIKIHMDFKNTVQAYKEQLSKDFSAKTLKSFIGTMLAWLVNHVCVCDRKILKNMPLQSMESFANTESFIENVAHKLFTEMYNILYLLKIKGGYYGRKKEEWFCHSRSSIRNYCDMFFIYTIG
jgi:hypothetical protein